MYASTKRPTASNVVGKQRSIPCAVPTIHRGSPKQLDSDFPSRERVEQHLPLREGCDQKKPRATAGKEIEATHPPFHSAARTHYTTQTLFPEFTGFNYYRDSFTKTLSEIHRLQLNRDGFPRRVDQPLYWLQSVPPKKLDAVKYTGRTRRVTAGRKPEGVR